MRALSEKDEKRESQRLPCGWCLSATPSCGRIPQFSQGFHQDTSTYSAGCAAVCGLAATIQRANYKADPRLVWRRFGLRLMGQDDSAPDVGTPLARGVT